MERNRLKQTTLDHPKERMKSGKEHRVPLSSEAIAILNDMEAFKINNFIFTGLYENESISDATILNLLQETNPTLTVHGFRSTFRDWCAEVTNFPSNIAESALAHEIKNATQAAYERGDKLKKRRKLMAAWAKYCTTTKSSSVIIPIRKKG